LHTIHNPGDFADLLRRIESLNPDSPRGWGKMTSDQMLAHVNSTLEAALGRVRLPDRSNFLTRSLLRFFVLADLPVKKNASSSMAVAVGSVFVFDAEKAKLLYLLKAASANGPSGEWFPHVTFGPLTGDEWGRLIWKHTDHHIRQFGG
jgi:hypothetical protein